MLLPEISRSMLRNAMVLGLFAIVTVGSVTLLRQTTAERIEKAERAAEAKALGEKLPPESYDNDLISERRLLQHELLGSSRALPGYLAQKDGKPSAVILQVLAPDGYSGAIHLLVGIQADGRLAGVRVIGHRETPGLGDKIELAKSDWILGFNGKSLQQPDEAGWAVKKDRGEFEQFAGATITPRAVVAAVHRALRYFDTHRDELLGRDAPTAVSAETPQRPTVHSRAGTAGASDDREMAVPSTPQEQTP